MIIYQNSKKEFFEDVKTNQISDIILELLKANKITGGSQSEINSWTNSLSKVKDILDDESIPNDIQIACEFVVPFSNQRIDCIITGHDQNGNKNAVIVELKQWSNAQDSGYLNKVISYNGRLVNHPSMQVENYKRDFFNHNKLVNNHSILCTSVSYLHNASSKTSSNLVNTKLYPIVQESPIFFKEDYCKLQSLIKSLVSLGNGKQILSDLNKEDYREDKEIQDNKKPDKLISNTSYFQLSVEQQTIIDLIKEHANKNNNVFIIKGEPGTGKSVIGLKLFGDLKRMNQNVVYATPNSAYKFYITNELKFASKKDKSLKDYQVLGTGEFYNKVENFYDWVIVDEAHRLKRRGAQGYTKKGCINQIKDVLKSSKNVVFFVDNTQRIRNEDIGSLENIIHEANLFNKHIFNDENYQLSIQKRCLFSTKYIDAVNNALQIQNLENMYLNDDNYEFVLCDSPQQMEELLRQKADTEIASCKILAGQSWRHISKGLKDIEFENTWDIQIPEYEWYSRWNKTDGKFEFINGTFNRNEVGSIHYAQGLEWDYCGVIIGNELELDKNGKLVCNLDEYTDSHGKWNAKNNKKEVDDYIKNIYKVLMTRGAKGTFLFVRNHNLREYFSQFIK